jgi:anaphase-promoting complex subunit 6
MDKVITKLRALVQESLDKHLTEQAIYFASKLVTITNGHAEDVYSLAQAFYQTKQYRRALHVLTKNNHHKTNIKCRYLAAKCKAECGDWGECLELLEVDENNQTNVNNTQILNVCTKQTHNKKAIVPQENNNTDSSHSEATTVSLQAAICFLKGQAYEALENRSKASSWYQKALHYDIYCYEAFDRLVSNHMLTHCEESELLKSLSFTEDSEWLKQLYTCKLLKYNQIEDLEEPFQVLETQFGLKNNDDLIMSKAETYYYHGNYPKAYKLSKELMVHDPYNTKILVAHISCLVELDLKNELFYLAHKLVEENSENFISWYAVGAYYYLIENNEKARKYFSKSTSMNGQFGAGWIGFGHSFARDGEHDQAIAAYRSAARVLFGSHLPLLCIGMELIRAHNLPLAQEYILKAKGMCPFDPLIYNELGVIFFKNKNYPQAADSFKKALELTRNVLNETWESTLFNLGHCYRKMRDFDRAAKCYREAITATTIPSHKASICTALGFVHHLQGKLEEACRMYHEALSYNSEDMFAQDLLSNSLEELYLEMNHFPVQPPNINQPVPDATTNENKNDKK